MAVGGVTDAEDSERGIVSVFDTVQGCRFYVDRVACFDVEAHVIEGHSPSSAGDVIDLPGSHVPVQSGCTPHMDNGLGHAQPHVTVIPGMQ